MKKNNILIAVIAATLIVVALCAAACVTTEDTQINDAFALFKKMKLVIQLYQLERRTGAVTFPLCHCNVRIVQLALQPLSRCLRTFFGRFDVLF